MNLDEQFFLDRIHGAGSSAGAGGPQGLGRVGAIGTPSATDPTSSPFRVLLEKLEEMARGSRTYGAADPAGTDPSATDPAATDPAATGGESGSTDGGPTLDAFQRDLAAADDDFVAAMELRRSLEAAYRRLAP